jgi:pyruvate formate lyase activating enzyme
MDIAYLQSVTLIDYPRRIAAMVFTTGCNFRCPFCHNPELVIPEKIRGVNLLPCDHVLSLLRERKGFLDGLVVTGGEPTIHADLGSFLRRVKDLGLLVKLDTNGACPSVLEKLLGEGLLDFVAMDLKSSMSRYDEFAGVPVDIEEINRSIRLIIERAPDYEFRTTVAPTMTVGDIEEIVALIKGAKRYWLQRFVIPRGKELVNPTWGKKTALGEEVLHTVWNTVVRGHIIDGGVR